MFSSIGQRLYFCFRVWQVLCHQKIRSFHFIPGIMLLRCLGKKWTQYEFHESQTHNPNGASEAARSWDHSAVVKNGLTCRSCNWSAEAQSCAQIHVSYVMHRHGALNVHPMPGAMKARTLPIYCIYIYIYMKTSESESSFCLRMCPPGTLRNSRALGYLDWSRLLSQIYENENGEFQIEVRFQSKYIVSMRITTMLISSLSQHFDLCNLDQIGLVSLSSTFQSWVMEMFSH